MDDPLLPIAFALSAAAFFGAAIHFQRRGLDHMDGGRGALIGIAASVLVFAAPGPLYIEAAWWTAPATLIFVLCGCFMPAISTMLAIRSVGIVGPGLSSAMGSFGPFFAILLAAGVLDEPFGLREASGLALMTSGLILTAGVRRVSGADWPIWALGFGLGAAFFRGAFQPLAKIGLEEVPSPLFAALVMSAVSAALLAARQLAVGRRGQAWPRAGALWYAGAGILNGLGIVALNAALGAGRVSIAAPLSSTTPLWALFFGAVVFRSERITPRHLLVAALVVAGAALIVWRPQ
ncbi:MAG: DMT family transporter [Pseudomonadota bacterium]